MRRLGLRGQLGVFSALFASGMWMSKIAQPLHFADAGALVAFGLGYAVMAVVGGLSFVWGALADRIGGLPAMRIGVFLYAIGIAGRVLTDVVPAVLFSALAGAGASMALVGIRPWIRSRAEDTDVPRIVGGRNLGNQVGVFAGTLGAAGIFAVVAQRGGGTEVALLVAPVFVLAAGVWLLGIGGSSAAPVEVTAGADAKPARSFSALAVRLGIVGVLSGFYVSLVTPYLPLYLTRGGLSDAAAAIVVAAMSVAQIATTAVVARRGIGRRPYLLFFVTEAATGVLTACLALVLGASVVVLALLFIARASFVAIAVTAEETIQYAVLPTASAGFLFGISQTAFLVGDAVGGAAGGPLWGELGPETLAVIAAVATLANAALMPVLLRPAGARRVMPVPSDVR